MKRYIETVEVKPFGCLGRYCIIDSEGDWFYDHYDNARTYKRPGNAVEFLRRSGYPWIVKMPSGRTLYVNCDNPKDAEGLGPHMWRKKNVVTISDQSGLYDIWRCELCSKETRRYGLSGYPPDGNCKKNPANA